MTGEQLKQLSKIKKLIISGNRRFAIRKDRDYLQELLDIGISEENAWMEILTLSANDYIFDFKPYYSKNNMNALTFKKIINGFVVYIKLIIEIYNNNEETVCLSFHIDYN